MNFHTPEIEQTDAPPSAIAAALPLHCNTPDEVIHAHIRSALDSGLPIITPVRPHDVPAIIVGGGPSVKDALPEMAQLHAGTVFALNGAGLWLLTQGIRAQAVVLLDARAHNAKFISGLDWRTHLFLATQCHPDVFAAARANGNRVTTWHATLDEEKGLPAELGETRHTVTIGAGTSVGMRALRLVHVLGYRTAHLFGYDSSYSPAGRDYSIPDRPEFVDQVSHAYPQPENEDDQRQGCMVNGRWFVSTPWMIRQAEDFKEISLTLMEEGMSIHVHGDGLLPEIARGMTKVLTAPPEAEGAPAIHPDAKIHAYAQIGDDVKIGAGTRVWQFASVIRGTVLGKDCNVASGALLDGPRFGDRCIICQNVAMGPGFLFGDDCFIGPNVTICNDAWPVTSKEGFDIERFRKGFWTVIVKDGASIGANAVVLPGVTIGAGAMIAAGAVVDRSVPDRSVFTRDGQIRALPGRMPVRMKGAAC